MLSLSSISDACQVGLKCVSSVSILCQWYQLCVGCMKHVSSVSLSVEFVKLVSSVDQLCPVCVEYVMCVSSVSSWHRVSQVCVECVKRGSSV